MSEHAAPRCSIAIFDFGGVLIDWNPRHLYRKLFSDEAAMEAFLDTVCTAEWNRHQDAGRSFAEGAALLKREHPDKAELIDAYFARWPEMMAGPIEGTIDILAELRRQGIRLYGLTNWSTETYPHALARFDFLGWFEGVVVSGAEGVIKPDPAIFRLLFERYGIDPAAAVYIDDHAANVAAAKALGMAAHHFTDPPALRRALVALGLLEAR
jgi:2-haloacid dehalogenase